MARHRPHRDCNAQHRSVTFRSSLLPRKMMATNNRMSLGLRITCIKLSASLVSTQALLLGASNRVSAVYNTLDQSRHCFMHFGHSIIGRSILVSSDSVFQNSNHFTFRKIFRSPSTRERLADRQCCRARHVVVEGHRNSFHHTNRSCWLQACSQIRPHCIFWADLGQFSERTCCGMSYCKSKMWQLGFQ